MAELNSISGGVRLHNLDWIKNTFRPDQVHIGAFDFIEDPTIALNRDISFGSNAANSSSGEALYQVVDREKLAQIIKKLLKA